MANDEVLRRRVGQLKAIVVFLADIIQASPREDNLLGWRSSRADEIDKTGPVYSYERVRAAAVLYGMNPSLIIVLSGGKTTLPGGENAPKISSVAARELARLGVPNDALVEESEAFNTLEQVVNCNRIAGDSRWMSYEIGILAPGWQMPRIVAFLESTRTVFITSVTSKLSMERVLAADDPAMNAWFSIEYAKPEVREMLAKDALGTAQILAGHQPQFPKPYRGLPDPLV